MWHHHSDHSSTQSTMMLNGGHRHLPRDVSAEELQRIRKRRQLAHKTPEQRRKLLQYHRRHNEKDGRLFFCDYCDLFISTSPRCRRAHLTSTRHMDAVEGYYQMAAHVECVWLKEITDAVARAQVQQIHEDQQARAGKGAATPLPARCIAHRIIVGGVVTHPRSAKPSCAIRTTEKGDGASAPSMLVGPAPSVRVGDFVPGTHILGSYHSNHSDGIRLADVDALRPRRSGMACCTPSAPLAIRVGGTVAGCVSSESSHHGHMGHVGTATDQQQQQQKHQRDDVPNEESKAMFHEEGGVVASHATMHSNSEV